CRWSLRAWEARGFHCAGLSDTCGIFGPAVAFFAGLDACAAGAQKTRSSAHGISGATKDTTAPAGATSRLHPSRRPQAISGVHVVDSGLNRLPARGTEAADAPGISRTLASGIKKAALERFVRRRHARLVASDRQRAAESGTIVACRRARLCRSRQP